MQAHIERRTRLIHLINTHRTQIVARVVERDVTACNKAARGLGVPGQAQSGQIDPAAIN